MRRIRRTITLLALGLAACGGDSDSTAQASPTSTAPATTRVTHYTDDELRQMGQEACGWLDQGLSIPTVYDELVGVPMRIEATNDPSLDLDDPANAELRDLVQQEFGVALRQGIGTTCPHHQVTLDTYLAS